MFDEPSEAQRGGKVDVCCCGFYLAVHVLIFSQGKSNGGEPAPVWSGFPAGRFPGGTDGGAEYDAYKDAKERDYHQDVGMLVPWKFYPCGTIVGP